MSNLPHVDYERRVFVTRSGVELHLQRLSSIVLDRLNADESGKPVVPKVEVKIAGKHTRMELNPEDSTYKAELAKWERERNTRLVKYVFVHGIADDAPLDFVQDHREYFPDASVRDMKYLWIGSLVDQSVGDLQLLVEAITGQSEITEAGLEAATESFPGDGRRDGHQALSLGESAGTNPDEFAV